MAHSLAGWRVVVDRADLPELDDDEFYVWQLQGATVLVGGEPRGRVVDVQSSPQMDVLVLAVEGDEVFVPCMKEFVLGWDLDAGTVELSADALA